mmetsp:Transcript_32222/g.43636  ORF Transcript_32222/g.43636 Transcript_32222/m.43636 type:complete len:148 (+) Transcript_32222:66-509(+)
MALPTPGHACHNLQKKAETASRGLPSQCTAHQHECRGALRGASACELSNPALHAQGGRQAGTLCVRSHEVLCAGKGHTVPQSRMILPRTVVRVCFHWIWLLLSFCITILRKVSSSARACKADLTEAIEIVTVSCGAPSPGEVRPNCV